MRTMSLFIAGTDIPLPMAWASAFIAQASVFFRVLYYGQVKIKVGKDSESHLKIHLSFPALCNLASTVFTLNHRSEGSGL